MNFHGRSNKRSNRSPFDALPPCIYWLGSGQRSLCTVLVKASNFPRLIRPRREGGRRRDRELESGMERKGGRQAGRGTLKSRFDGRYRDTCSLTKFFKQPMYPLFSHGSPFDGANPSYFCRKRQRVDRSVDFAIVTTKRYFKKTFFH